MFLSYHAHVSVVIVYRLKIVVNTIYYYCCKIVKGRKVCVQYKTHPVEEPKHLVWTFFFFYLTYSRCWTSSLFTILPVVTKDLPISPCMLVHALRFFIAMQVQHSYNSSTNG